MFTKLKKKIEEEIGDDISKLTSSLTGASLTERKASLTSLRSNPPSLYGSVTSLPDVSAILPLSPTEPTMGTLEEANGSPANLTNESGDERRRKKLSSNDDLQRQIRKLEHSLERQQDMTARRLEQKESEWKKVLEKREQEWERRVELLEREKEVLEEEKVEVVRQKLALEENLKVAEGYRDRLAKFQEDMDQLEGFQIQETAKVKHLLLNSQEDLQQAQKAVAEKAAALSAMSERVEALQADVERLREMENRMNDLQDEHDALVHARDLQQQKNAALLQEKETQLQHLTERVATLERRQEEEKMCGDERVQALLAERNGLEEKLEEARQHLNEIKTSWSEKITSLETQIAHLNEKIGEDSSEMRMQEEECLKLKEELNDWKSKFIHLEGGLKASNQQMEQLKAEKEELQKQLQTKEEASAQATAHVTALESELSSQREASNSATLEVQRLKEEVEASRDELRLSQEKVLHFTSSLQDTSSRLEATSALLQSKETQCSSLELQAEELRSSLSAIQLEKDQLLLRNAQASQETEMLRQQLREKESELSDAEVKATGLGKEVERLRAEMDAALQEAEGQLEAKIEGSQRVTELKTQLGHLEDQLADRNKTVKLQQQRLNEMKKTMQRELKLHPPGNNPGGEGGGGETLSLLQNQQPPTTPILHLPGSPFASHMDMASNNSLVLDTHDINFKYLKHVILKFLTSREYEAQHLVCAVATLLHCSKDEEKILRETLEYRMSWFGTRPNLGSGQDSKTIPPSF